MSDGNAYASGEFVRVTVGGSVTYHALNANGTPLTGAARRPATGRSCSRCRRRWHARTRRARRSSGALRSSTSRRSTPASGATACASVVEDETPGLVTDDARVVRQPDDDPAGVGLRSAAGHGPRALRRCDRRDGRRPRQGLEHQPRPRTTRSRSPVRGWRRRNRCPGSVCARASSRMTVRLLRQPDPRTPSRERASHRQRDVPQPLARPPAQQLRREGDRRHRRAAAQVGPPPRGFVAVHPRAATAPRPAPTRSRCGSDPRRSSTCCPTAAPTGPAAARTGRRRRLDRLAHRRALHRHGQRRPRAADRPAELAQRRGDQHRRDSRPSSAPRSQQAVIDHCELLRYRFAVLDSTARADGHDLRRAETSGSSSTPSTPRSTTRG